MKKFLIFLFVLALSVPAALAEAPATEDFNMGDFTITMDSEIPGQIYDKSSADTWWVVYPAYTEGDSVTALRCTWLSAAATDSDWTDENLEDLVSTLEESYKDMSTDQYDVVSYTVERPFTWMELDGMPCVYYMTVVVYDFSKLGEGYEAINPTTYMATWMTRGELGKGSYIFYGSADTPEAIEKWITPLVESVRWN